MRLDGEDCYFTLVWPISPKNSTCSRCPVLKIGLEDLHPILAAQFVDLVGGEAVVLWVGGESTQSLDQFLEQFLLHLTEGSAFVSRGEILPQCRHFRQAHSYCERHPGQDLMNFAKSMGTDAFPAFSELTD